MHTTLSPRRELLLLLSLAGIQFTHIVDFMIMMPLGPQLPELFDISFAELVYWYRPTPSLQAYRAYLPPLL